MYRRTPTLVVGNCFNAPAMKGALEYSSRSGHYISSNKYSIVQEMKSKYRSLREPRLVTGITECLPDGKKQAHVTRWQLGFPDKFIPTHTTSESELVGVLRYLGRR